MDGMRIRGSVVFVLASLLIGGCEPTCRCSGEVEGVGPIDVACGETTCVAGVGLGCFGPNMVSVVPEACTAPDVDVSVEDAGATPDVPADTGPPPPMLYEVCASDLDCDAGLRCDTRFPNGVCTRDCVRDSDCGTGVCTVDGCAPGCRSGALECDRFGGACAVYLDVSLCVPTCNARISTGCPGGRTCDGYRGECTTSPVTAGADIGAPCMRHEQCRSGFCLMEIVDGQPTGFLGGMCAGSNRSRGLGYPPQAGGCPSGSVLTNGNPEGDLTLCMPSCTSDARCRSGYYCSGAPEGYCRPLNCSTGITLRSCPAGTSCEAVPGSATRICVRCVPDCSGRTCGDDGCGGSCGTCGGLDRCSAAGRCECVGESDAVLCASSGANCGSMVVTDGCGVSRTVDCGTCATGTCGAVTPNRCCVPETDSALCAAVGANCGSIAVADACGGARAPSCGTCTSPATCGAIAPNRCGCIAETPAELCAARGATCGTLSTVDRCGVSRDVSCGTCTSPETCGGAGTPNTCGICVPSCGARVCGNDGCGGSCGSCPTDQRCSTSGACEPIPCDPVTNARCPDGQKCEWTGSTTACVAAGTGRVETPCLRPSDCAPEHTCTAEGFCREYCTTSLDCRAGRCALDATGSPYGLCSIPCDPTYAAWSGGGTGCTYEECRLLDTARATEFPDCGHMGGGFDDAACTLTEQCYSGRACISSRCRRVCRLGTSCGTGICTSVPGWITYGYCP